jgi:hypothetical protein
MAKLIVIVRERRNNMSDLKKGQKVLLSHTFQAEIVDVYETREDALTTIKQVEFISEMGQRYFLPLILFESMLVKTLH